MLQAYLHVIVEKDVTELEISMDDLVLVEVLDAQEDLLHEVSRLRLGDGLSPLVQLHHGASAAKLEDDVDKVVVLEVAEELDDVDVVKGLVKRDLLGHLLALVRLDQEGLGHDLAGHDLAGLDILELVALGEATLEGKGTKGQYLEISS